MFDLPKYGRGLCLARLARLLEEIGVDRARLASTSLVVTGSNGKGSTAAFAAGIGTAFGLRTGLFTSPHLIRFNERFRVDGEPIGDAALDDYVARIAAGVARVAAVPGLAGFGAFEAQFALACLLFQDSGCDLAVLEAGIGGRFDPVRLACARHVAVTSLDLEHTSLLGDTLELICADKSDACAAGGTIIYGESCRELKPFILEHNRGRQVSSLFVREDIAIGSELIEAGGQSFDLGWRGLTLAGLETGPRGTFQINNAAIAAVLVIEWLRKTTSASSPALEAAVRTGLAETRWPGRLETIAGSPLTVIDVGHTPDGVRQALASIERIHGLEGWVLVTGVSEDKKADEIVGLLAPHFATIVCTRAHHKGADVELIRAAAKARNPRAALYLTEAIEEAVEVSQRLAREQGGRVLVAGGLFLAVEYATALSGGNPRALLFF